MSAAELLTVLDRLGIKLEGHGDRLRYHPRSALTRELIARLKAHKDEILSILGQKAAPQPVAVGLDGWPTNSIKCDELTPCLQCRSLELWQSVVGDPFGL